MFCSDLTKRTGLFNITTGEILPECGCYDEVIFPIDAILYSIPKNVKLAAADRLFPAKSMAARVSSLAGLRVEKTRKLTDVFSALDLAQDVLNKARAKVDYFEGEISKIIQSAIDSSAALKTAKENYQNTLNEIRTAYRIAIKDNSYAFPGEQFVMDLAAQNVAAGLPPYTSNPWYTLVTSCPDLIVPFVPAGRKNKILFNSDGLPVGGDLYEEILELAKEDEALSSALVDLQKSLIEAEVVRFQSDIVVKKWEADRNFLVKGIQDIDEAMVQSLDNISLIGRFNELSGPILRSVDLILSLMSIVQTHQCQDPSLLNPETCKCDNDCPEGKELCANYLQDWYLPRYPRPLPGSSVADERNYCTDKCCGGKVNLWKETYLAGGGCVCECPNIGGTWWPVGRLPPPPISAGWNPVGIEQESKPCNDPNKGCEGKICAPKNPPVPGAQWNPNTCEWGCPNPDQVLCNGNCMDKCPEGQTREYSPITCECKCKNAGEVICDGACVPECPSGQKLGPDCTCVDENLHCCQYLAFWGNYEKSNPTNIPSGWTCDYDTTTRCSDKFFQSSPSIWLDMSGSHVVLDCSLCDILDPPLTTTSGPCIEPSSTSSAGYPSREAACAGLFYPDPETGDPVYNYVYFSDLPNPDAAGFVLCCQNGATCCGTPTTPSPT